MNRFRSKLARVLLGVAAAAVVAVPGARSARADDQPVKALLILGGCCHDYAKQKDIIPAQISAKYNVEWAVAYDPDKTTKHLNPVYANKDWYKGFDVIVHDECSADVKDLDVINNTILAPHKDGLPAVVLHCGMHCYRSEGWPKVVTPWFEFTGLQTTGHGAQLPIAITFVDKDNEITKGMADWTTIHEELYNNIAGNVLPTAHALARGKQVSKDKQGNEKVDDTIVAWTNLYNGKTKVFATTIGHNNETVADPRYVELVGKGLLWSVGKLDADHMKPAKQVMIDGSKPGEKAEAQPTGELLKDAVASAGPVLPSQTVFAAAADNTPKKDAPKAQDKEKSANPKKGEIVADPAKILASVKGPKGYDVTIFGMPPEVAYVTCISAAPNGEVFVGIDEDGSLGKDPNRGRVIRAVDTDGDGKADKFTVFAKMDHPRGLVWDDGKLYVLHPPYLGLFEDDGTGKSKPEKILVSGISTEQSVAARGADHTTNGIRLGIDGWIYIAMGDFGAVKAVGTDGKPFQEHGGGIMRVRPDGTDLEVYSHGHRNIYDVSIDPLMNVFTRDNTNDGDNWNDRLAYIVPTGYYGYPSYFMHFPGEFIDCLADYGGGSPCGSMWIDEPGITPGLYTVEWGRSVVDRHPMTPSGANFKAGQEQFMAVPRGTDIDVDAQGHIYVSSWANGGFSYSGPNVGFVVRLTPQGAKPQVAPEFRKASDEQLLGLISSSSATVRQAAQREMLRRGSKPLFVEGLEKIASGDGLLQGRSAAIFTLKLLEGEKADEALAKLSQEKPAVRELALRALADQRGDKSADIGAFVKALSDENPRVRLVAAWGLNRLGRPEGINPLLPLVADKDPLVAHVATQSLIALHAVDACLAAVDESHADLLPGAVRVLQHIHDPAVVDALVAKVGQIHDPALRGDVYAGLARLFHNEAEWDGKWWGTRPDTTGPYYNAVAWEGTSRIGAALAGALGTEQGEALRGLVKELQRNGVDSPEIAPKVAAAAEKDPQIKAIVVESLANRKSISDDQVKLLKGVAVSSEEPTPVRVKAVRGLERAANNGNGAASTAAIDVLAGVVNAEHAPAELAGVLNEYLRDGAHASKINEFMKLAEAGDSGAKRELGYAVLVNLATSKLVKPQQRDGAAKVVERGWEKPTTAVALLRAIGLTKNREYAAKVVALKTDARPAVAQTAGEVAALLGTGGGAGGGKTIEDIGYDATVAAVQKAKDPGDAKLGAELFVRQGCVQCHTTSPAEPPKGPMLGGIAERYNRSELAESIMKPSAKIAQGFETQWFKTAENNDVLEGFVTRESGDELEFRNVAGVATTLKKSDIKERGKRETSVMPEGLVAKLTPHDLASIMAYLESLKGK